MTAKIGKRNKLNTKQQFNRRTLDQNQRLDAREQTEQRIEEMKD